MFSSSERCTTGSLSDKHNIPKYNSKTTHQIIGKVTEVDGVIERGQIEELVDSPLSKTVRVESVDSSTTLFRDDVTFSTQIQNQNTVISGSNF